MSSVMLKLSGSSKSGLLVSHPLIDYEDSRHSCRICWSGEDDDFGGDLLTPCNCKGTLRHVHQRCLGEWQHALRLQKGIIASRRCDICKSPWAIRCSSRLKKQALVGTAIDAVRSSWPILKLAIDVWQAAIMLNGVREGLHQAIHSQANHRSRGHSAFGPVHLGAVSLAFGAAAIPILFPFWVVLGSTSNLEVFSILNVFVRSYLTCVLGFFEGIMKGLTATANVTSAAITNFAGVLKKTGKMVIGFWLISTRITCGLLKTAMIAF